MPSGLSRPCLALLALLLSAFGGQRLAAAPGEDRDDRPCLQAFDMAPQAVGLALLPDGGGPLPPLWRGDLALALGPDHGDGHRPALPPALPAACLLRRGSAGGARAP